LNGELDHLFKLPVSPLSMVVTSASVVAPGERVELCFEEISAPKVWIVMSARIIKYLASEGSLAQLAKVKLLCSVPDVCLASSVFWFERIYWLIKQRMVRRSVPIALYPSWKEIVADELERFVGETPCYKGGDVVISVIICVGSKDREEDVHATIQSIRNQSCSPADFVVVHDTEQDWVSSVLGDTSEVRGVPGNRCAEYVASLKEGNVMFLKAGDVLDSSALRIFNKTLTENGPAECVYSDEEFIESEVDNLVPVLKPDFDPYLLRSAQYIGRACVYSVQWLQQVFSDTEHDAILQNFDLSEPLAGLSSSSIRHVPFVLMTSSHRELAKVDKASLSFSSGSYPLVSIIIPTRDCLEMLQPCIGSIVGNTDYSRFEIIVVDNQSRNLETQTYLEELGRSDVARIITVNEPFNYSALNNKAVASAKGSVLAFLNNDIEIKSPAWLSEMVALAETSGIGSVGARLLYPDGSIQHAGVAMGIGLAGHPWKGADPSNPHLDIHVNRLKSVSANTGACLVVRKDHFESVGGFDESLAVAFNDVDLCLKLQVAGLRNVWTPEATLIHHESVSRGRNNTPEKRRQFESEKRIMRQRWGDTLKSDPYYNPNLTYEVEDGGLALFPRHLYPKKWWQF